jgi:hypothetical protein
MGAEIGKEGVILEGRNTGSCIQRKCVSIFSKGKGTEECLLSARSALQQQFGSFSFSPTIQKNCHTKFGRMKFAKKLYVGKSLVVGKRHPIHISLKSTKPTLQIPNAHTFSQGKSAFIAFYRSSQFVDNTSHIVQGFLYCMNRAA